MTENKRFIYAKSEGGVGYAIYDTTKTYTFPNLPREYEAKLFCKILNELYGENEELKKRLSDLQKENYGNIDGIAFYQEENASLCEKISDLECENEDLKKENKDLKTSKEYWREKCLSKDSYNKLYHKAPIWFTQELKLTDKQANEIAEAINQSLKERRIKE